MPAFGTAALTSGSYPLRSAGHVTSSSYLSGNRPDRRLPRFRRSGGLVVGRGQDPLRDLPHPRGTVLPRTWVARRVVLAQLTGHGLSPTTPELLQGTTAVR